MILLFGGGERERAEGGSDGGKKGEVLEATGKKCEVLVKRAEVSCSPVADGVKIKGI